jgi:hypothetical protein
LFLVALGIACAAAALVVIVGRARNAPFLSALVGIVVAAAIWLGALVLQSRGWRDTDGWVDCNTYCNGWHRLGAIMFWTPVATCLLLVIAVTVGLFVRVRHRRAAR